MGKEVVAARGCEAAIKRRRALSHSETKIYSILGLRQNAQRAALRAAGQATSGKFFLRAQE